MLKKKTSGEPRVFSGNEPYEGCTGQKRKEPKLCVCSAAKEETAKESRFSEVQESVSNQGAWGWGIPQQIKGQQNL